MSFYHCLQQELDDFRVKIAANQYLGGGPDECHIIRWNVLVNIDHTLWQYQPSELWEDTGESLRPWKAHKANIGISDE